MTAKPLLSRAVLTGDEPPSFIQRIEFPNDAKLRADILPLNKHPAKMNLHLLEYIITHHTDPDDIIYDPMAGIGTILLAATMRRRTYASELEDDFYGQLCNNYFHLQRSGKLNAGVYLKQGNAAHPTGLPLPYSITPSVICLSPPYGDTARRKRHAEAASRTRETVPEWVKGRTDPGFHVDSYGDEFLQIGNMAYPLHLLAMKAVYRNCAECLPKGGTLIVVTADFWRGWERVPYWSDTHRLIEQAGFTLTHHWQRDRSRQLGAFNRVRQKQGRPTIDEEDVQVFQR